jgi:hypothetical protein
MVIAILLVLISIIMLSITVLPIPSILRRSSYTLLRRIIVLLQRREPLIDLLLLLIVVIVIVALLVRFAVHVSAAATEDLLQDAEDSDDEGRHRCRTTERTVDVGSSLVEKI